jgi:hypothetical protein
MLPIDSEEDYIARTVEVAAAIRQQPGIFELTCQSLLLRHCWLCIEVSGCMFEHML